MQKFWMIHGDGCPKPTHRHESIEAALAEARRLAGLHPERAFVVLEAVVVARAEPRPVRLDLVDEPPPGAAVATLPEALAAAATDAVAEAVAGW